MSLKCLMNGLEVNYPCSPTCALFGDCCTAFEVQKKSRVVTNADHIRSMTDEELALFFGRLGFCNGVIPRSHCHAHKVCGQGCVVDWLKQPFAGGE